MHAVIAMLRDFSDRHFDSMVIAYASMLSLLCLARGAVYDTILAIALLALLPMLCIALTSERTIYRPLAQAGGVLITGFLLVLLLQQWVPGSDSLWPEIQRITGAKLRNPALVDKAAWVAGLGRTLFFIGAFVVALIIGARESSARLFFHALLLSGVSCITLTFFFATREGVPSSTYYSYHHGLVNANNAATYLGVMLLVALAQAARFFKPPTATGSYALLDRIDALNVMLVLRGGFLLFSMLLALAGLFMTGSRGGIFLSLFCVALFCAVVTLRFQPHAKLRKAFIAGFLLLIGALLVWNFINFGEVLTSKLVTDGTDSNARFDMFSAVMPMLHDRPWLGSGLGSFPAAFQAYRPDTISADGIIDKAHNSYLEFGAEMGLPALALLLTIFGWVGAQLYRGVKGRTERYIVPMLGLCVWLLMALHSLVDFPLQIPGLFALTLALVTICLSQADPILGQPANAGKTPTKRRRIRKRRSKNEPPEDA